jgi:uncharacterized protein YegP (UPF0339 family)
MHNILKIFKDRSGYWRWTALSGENREPLADSGEGYTRRDDAIKGFRRVATMALGGAIEVENLENPERIDFGFNDYSMLRDWFERWGVGFSEYTEDDQTKSLVLEEGPHYWIFNFTSDGSFKSSVPGTGMEPGPR